MSFPIFGVITIFSRISSKNAQTPPACASQVKQADVILLGWPYLFDMPPSVREADLRYYSPRTDPGGPAMTWAMFAIGWLDIGDEAEANAVFKRGYANQQPPFQVPPSLYQTSARRTGSPGLST